MLLVWVAEGTLQTCTYGSGHSNAWWYDEAEDTFKRTPVGLNFSDIVTKAGVDLSYSNIRHIEPRPTKRKVLYRLDPAV